MSGGHGWVTPRPDGVRARCGGPGVCRLCQVEAGRPVFARRDEIAAQLSAERDVTVDQVYEVLDGLAGFGVDVDRLVPFPAGGVPA